MQEPNRQKCIQRFAGDTDDRGDMHGARNRSRTARSAAAVLISFLVSLLVCAAPIATHCEAGMLQVESRANGDEKRADVLPHDVHARWSRILAQNVRSGAVDYAAIERTARDELDAYLAELQSVSRNILFASSRNAQLAFWINAYNAFTVRLILDHYPVEGIWKIVPLWKRAFGGPFAIDFIPLGRLAPDPTSEPLSLGFVEHEILRAHFSEPMIHFAIVCASKSCPPLASEAYRARDLGDQLAASARAFLASPAENRYEAAANALWVSPIFKWFDEDFEKGGGPAGYFARFGPASAAAELERAETPPKLGYTHYDWDLNAR